MKNLACVKAVLLGRKSFSGCSLATSRQSSIAMLELHYAEGHRRAQQRCKRLIIEFHKYFKCTRERFGNNGSTVLETKWMQSQQSIEPECFFSQCGAHFISYSPPVFGFCLCQVNWTEKKGGGEAGTKRFLDHLGHQASHLLHRDESTSPSTVPFSSL